MKIVIAGGKAKADYLIRLLNGKGHQLIVINDDLEFCTYLSQAHQIPVVRRSVQAIVLDEANIEDGDVIIALKAAGADNLAICQDRPRDFTALRKRLPLSAIRKVSISLKNLELIRLSAPLTWLPALLSRCRWWKI